MGKSLCDQAFFLNTKSVEKYIQDAGQCGSDWLKLNLYNFLYLYVANDFVIIFNKYFYVDDVRVDFL